MAKQIYNTLKIAPKIILTTADNNFNNTKSFRLQVHLSTAGSTTEELAYFNIYGNYIRAPFEQLTRLNNNKQFAPPLMNIDCSDYEGQGVSKMLILIAFHYAKKEYPRFNDMSELFIDVDASNIVGHDVSGNKVSYWSAIGMVENETNPSNYVSTGYEKRCFVRDLKSYLFRIKRQT
jgi:S-adenosylmethionine/arginine decarboxylase-like enzyme